MNFGFLTFNQFYMSTTNVKNQWNVITIVIGSKLWKKIYKSMNIIREYRVRHSHLHLFSIFVRMLCIFFVKWTSFTCKNKVLWNFTKNQPKVFLKESLKSLFKRNCLFNSQLQPLKTKTICNRYSRIQSSRSQCVSKSSRVVKNHNYQWQVIICSCNTFISILKRI